MKIYTKKGDKGETSFFGGLRIGKDDLRIEAIGAIDELNSAIGIAMCFVDTKLNSFLCQIQDDLFTLGADLASYHLNHELPRVKLDHVEALEQAIDKIDSTLPKQNSFIMPRGTPACSFLHLCRSIARRTERSLVRVQKVHGINESALSYINRLSDFFFIIARHANNEVNVSEQQPIYKYFKHKDY